MRKKERLFLVILVTHTYTLSSQTIYSGVSSYCCIFLVLENKYSKITYMYVEGKQRGIKMTTYFNIFIVVPF